MDKKKALFLLGGMVASSLVGIVAVDRAIAKSMREELAERQREVEGLKHDMNTDGLDHDMNRTFWRIVVDEYF